MEILITGGTGLVGKQLTRFLLQDGHSVTILTRDPSRANLTKSKFVEDTAFHSLLQFAGWDVNAGRIDQDAINRAEAIIHLAGAGVADKRWTSQRKTEILNSRVDSGKLLVAALQKRSGSKPQVFISSSAIGWYGPDPAPHPQGFLETDAAFTDFLGTTCEKWEQATDEIANMGIRRVLLRTGIVMTPAGGAMKEFIKPIKMGVAAVLGSGSQIVSWIHLNDLCRMFTTALLQNSWEGPVNAVAPHPVSNAKITKTIAQQLKPGFHLTLPVPSFVLKIMLGEMSIEVLKSCTVSAEKAQGLGFQFAYPTIESAVAHLLKD